MPPIISGDLLRLRSRLALFSICEDLSANESSFVGEQSTTMSPPHFSQQAPLALSRLLLPRSHLRPPRSLCGRDSLSASSGYGALAPLRCNRNYIPRSYS